MESSPLPDGRRRFNPKGRVTFVYPGKHGDRDLRVEFCGKAPTHAELLTMIYGVLWAEGRYNEPWQEGRHMFAGLIQRLVEARCWEEAEPIIVRAEKSVELRRAA